MRFTRRTFLRLLTQGEPETRANRADFTNRALFYELLNFECLRMQTVHESFHQQPAIPLGGGNHPPALGHIERHRLFTEHVLASFERTDGPLAVQVIRQRVVDHIYIGILQQPLIASITVLKPSLTRIGLSFFAAAAGHCVSSLRTWKQRLPVPAPVQSWQHPEIPSSVDSSS